MYLSSPARSTWRANSAWFVSFLFGVQWIAVGYFLIIIIIGENTLYTSLRKGAALYIWNTSACILDVFTHGSLKSIGLLSHTGATWMSSYYSWTKCIKSQCFIVSVVSNYILIIYPRLKSCFVCVSVWVF